ncbi:MAG: molecular chaperone HtpG, partial [Mesosutterella sp.]|nr:molecular chaperone HtpG [Mesosutterella sp.]
SLLYIPKEAPWDLYSRDEKHGLKLYVQRVFIMDNSEEFLPNYLRFVKGLVDTTALDLNVSRELLQKSPVTRKLKRALTKRALSMIEKLAADKDKYQIFWSQYGRVMKEGPIEDPSDREQVMKLLRFASTKSGTAAQTVSLEDYIARMPEKQKNIYYLTAGSYEAAANSPYLETLRKKGIEVLLLTDRVDEWLMGNVRDFEGHSFVPATASDLQLGDLADKDDQKKKDEAEKDNKGVVERLKKALEGKVTNVRISTRLVDSPSCIVGEQDQMLTPQMRRMLEAAGQSVPEEKFTLEINPEHPLIRQAADETDEARFGKWADFIYGQALLADQGSLKDPSSFVKIMNELILKK